jgi:16S rRNA (guanine527-N7)-methyltransferase
MISEDEARDWLRTTLSVSRETEARLAAFVDLVVAENEQQNLVSAATIPHIWARHILDSAQLLVLAEGRSGAWLDLGSGPGFPGIVLAILTGGPVHMVEERKARVAFLERACEALGLDQARVHGCKVQRLSLPPVDVITARAFAPLPKLFALAHGFSTQKTLWVLPKGKSAHAELESVRGTWQGMFHVKQSITDADSAIITATGVRRTGKA